MGEAAHLLTVVRGHSWTTSLVFSSTRMTDSLVMPSKRGTSLFLLFIFSCRRERNRERERGSEKRKEEKREREKKKEGKREREKKK